MKNQYALRFFHVKGSNPHRRFSVIRKSKQPLGVLCELCVLCGSIPFFFVLCASAPLWFRGCSAQCRLPFNRWNHRGTEHRGFCLFQEARSLLTITLFSILLPPQPPSPQTTSPSPSIPRPDHNSARSPIPFWLQIYPQPNPGYLPSLACHGLGLPLIP